jgi:serine/threonine protein kinase
MTQFELGNVYLNIQYSDFIKNSFSPFPFLLSSFSFPLSPFSFPLSPFSFPLSPFFFPLVVMPLYFQTSKKHKITVQDSPLSSAGGEGQVHQIISPSSYKKRYCVKIFHLDKRTKEREQKIIYMIKNPPSELDGGTFLICWPTELVYENNQFVGFIMPLAFKGSIALYELCRPVLKKNLPTEWYKFDITTNTGVLLRLKLCVNIAIAIHKIHQLNHYVLVDMKPQNMLVTKAGKISIIDLDSIQIANGSRVIHPSHAVTAEYIPPEGYQQNLHPSIHYIEKSWDRFSMAVIFYEVLFGLPPYAATYGGQYTDCDTIPEKIQSGLFPHGTKARYIESLPKWHNNFKKIPPPLKLLFFKAFEEGHNRPNVRPTAQQWGQVFYKEVAKLESIEQPILSQSSNFSSKFNQLTTAIRQPIQTLFKMLLDFLIESVLFVLDGIYQILKRIVSFIFFLIAAIFYTILGIPIVLLFMIAIIFMLMTNAIVYGLTFSRVTFWKKSVFMKMQSDLTEWIIDTWDYEEWRNRHF